MITIDLIKRIKQAVYQVIRIHGYCCNGCQARINDVITCSNDTKLRIHVLAPAGRANDLAIDANYG